MEKKVENSWIRSPLATQYNGAVDFQKSFLFSQKPISLTLEVSAVGLYEASLNGKKVGDRVLTPGFTSYNKRGVQVQSYTLTQGLDAVCCVSVAVAPGWAVGHIGYTGDEHIFADHVSLTARLTFAFADGNTQVFYTDASWRVWTHEVTFSDIYNGERVDKTHVPAELGAAVLDKASFALIDDVGEPICEQERFGATLIVTPMGERVLDFGQNMTGYVTLRIRGERGRRVRLSFGEVLDKEGNFYNENYRRAKNEVVYIMSGGDDFFRPRFSFQGFRYVRVDEYPTDEIDVGGFEAVAVHSDMRRIGYLKTANERINRLYHNIVWGQKSNYLDIPTDCPQRDERLGWTGDAQVFCRTAATNYDVRKFFDKWLADLRAEQTEIGEIFGTCPETVWAGSRPHTRISAAWGDAATIIPWTLYEIYGEERFLAENFDMMCRWVDYMHAAGDEEFLWLGGSHYGDWLALDATEDSYEGITSPDLIASAFFAYSTSLVVRAGEVLGREMTHYRTLYENVRVAFCKRYLDDILSYKIGDTLPEGAMGGRITQTALALILHFNLCEREQRGTLCDKLVRLIELYGGKMSTGFVGTPYILHALSENGRADVAYRLLFNEDVPSWLYSVDRGATTMWEHWDSIKQDDSFWSADMNSFNHYAYGAVGDWLYGAAAGVQIDEAGYRRVTLRPFPDKRFGKLECSIETPFGKLISDWKFENDKITYHFVVPKGIIANICLQNGHQETVEAGEYFY